MKYYSWFNLPNWKKYQSILLNYYHNNGSYDLVHVDPDSDNFMYILSVERLQRIVPTMVKYFDNLGLKISFLMILGRYEVNINPYDYIHKDYSPIEDKFYMSSYAVNFVLKNTENSHLVFFDEDKNEIVRVNYDHNPILFRGNFYHSVIDSSSKLRLAISIRFKEGSDLEKFF